MNDARVGRWRLVITVSGMSQAQAESALEELAQWASRLFGGYGAVVAAEWDEDQEDAE